MHTQRADAEPALQCPSARSAAALCQANGVLITCDMLYHHATSSQVAFTMLAFCRQDAAWQPHRPACRTEKSNGRHFIKCYHPPEYESCLPFAWADEFDAGPCALRAASDLLVLMHHTCALAPACSQLGSPSRHCMRVNYVGLVELMCSSTTGLACSSRQTAGHEALVEGAGRGGNEQSAWRCGRACLTSGIRLRHDCLRASERHIFLQA